MKKLAEEHEYIGKSIARIHKMSMMYLAKHFSKYNIGSGQCFFLVKIYNNPGITQEELALSMFFDKGTTARAIKVLEDNGYIKRVRREDDKRAYSIIATDKAEEIKEDVYSILNSWEETFKSGFTLDEGKQFVSLLNKLKDNNFFKESDVK